MLLDEGEGAVVEGPVFVFFLTDSDVLFLITYLTF
jgi:hypothetical protein